MSSSKLDRLCYDYNFCFLSFKDELPIFCDEEDFSPSDEEEFQKIEAELLAYEQEHPNNDGWGYGFDEPVEVEISKKLVKNRKPEKPRLRWCADFRLLVLCVHFNLREIVRADIAGNVSLVQQSFKTLIEILEIFDLWESLVRSKRKDVISFRHLNRRKDEPLIRIEAEELIKRGHYFRGAQKLRADLIKHFDDIEPFYELWSTKLTADFLHASMTDLKKKSYRAMFLEVLRIHSKFHLSCIAAELSMGDYEEFTYHPEIWDFYEKRLVFFFKHLLGLLNLYLLSLRVTKLSSTFLRSKATITSGTKFLTLVSQDFKSVSAMSAKESIVYDDYGYLPVDVSFLFNLRKRSNKNV